jgi:phenylacetate-CoA ligase
LVVNRATSIYAPLVDQTETLCGLLQSLSATNEFYRKKLGGTVKGFGSGSGMSLYEILRSLPFTTKAELQDDQERHPPFGTNLTFPLGRYLRIHRTSGTSGRPLWWLDTRESWDWWLSTWREIYSGLALRPSDRLFFPFSFGPFIGFWAAFEGAVALGHLAIPAGGMTTKARLSMLVETGATVVAATPTYALRMAEVAREVGLDLSASSVRAVVVAGEPGGSLPATRERIESEWGARCFDHCGMTEMGPVGFECVENPGGMHVIESQFLVEIVEPESGEPVLPTVHDSQGHAFAEGELVLTNLGREGSPLIRYRTGDFVRWSKEPCRCARPWGRLVGGILGRLDDMVFIRGNNVYPGAVEAIIRKFPEVAEFRTLVRESAGPTALEVEIEPAPVAAGSGNSPPATALRERVGSALEEALLFRAAVREVPPGSLPRFELKAKRFIKVREGET